MNNNILTSTRARRTAAMLCAVLAGLGLAHGAAAQVQEPQTNSPASPTPYQSPLFHAGGSDPALALTSPPFGPADLDPLNPLLLNPLYGQLQGTPTALVPGTGTNAGSFIPVQIPSFDLGAYNPNFAPGQGGITNVFYPDHLADGGVFSWQAPFNYVPLTVGLVTVDDTSPAPTAASGTTPGTSGFALTVNPGNWEQQAAGNAAGTATGGEYDRLKQGQNGAAVWTLMATTPGSFSVYFHIPDQIEDSTGIVEPRSTQVTYQITTTGANAITTTATVSQTEANSSQFLAGPFLLAVGDTVTVTLQRDNFHNQNTNRDPNGNGQVLQDYLIADSMTLQTSIGDVRSSPTAINASAYPADFARVKYWGIFVPPGTTNPVPATAGANNALPDTSDGTSTGTPIYRYGDTTKADPVHEIRQLVYFGRQDPTFSNGSTVDDQDGPPTPTKPGFTTSGFGQITDPTETATNGEYRTATAVAAGGPTATWSFIAPNGGDYYVTVHLPQTPPTPPNPAQKRVPAPITRTVNGVTTTVGGVPYTVTYPGGTQTILIGQNQTGDVTLPTGAIALNRGDVVTVKLTAETNLPNQPSYTVVADSVRLATGGSGAIYCVDGFTGGVVWRFQTPGGLNGPGAPVFSSPVVTKINVLVTPATGTTPAVYANKLVVIVGDDNGMVYCLDAIGNGDGASNSRAIDPASGLPIYIPQPVYNTPTPPTPVDQPGYLDANGFGHVGTTGAYWIYRPNPNRPKIVTGIGSGTVRQDARGDAILDPNSDLPVPAAFGTASPNVFINPLVSTTADAATGSIPLNPDGSAPSNAKVYVGNSNGVLYALDGVGVPTGGDTRAAFEASGDRFNASVDLRRSAGHFKFLADGTTPDPNYDPTDGFAPTPQPLWWFTLRGADANSTDNPSNADIESAPALYTAVTKTAVVVTGGSGTGTTTTYTYTYVPTVYIGSAHEVEATSNVGRLYALDGRYGPSGNNGLAVSDPAATPASGQYLGVPGGPNYNIGQRPQTSTTDAADWSFPDAYDRTTTNATKNNKGQSTNKLPRPALGNITGSPVVFTDTNENDATRRTRVYFAANVGLEVPTGSTVGTTASARPDDTETGRLWAVNLDGSVGRTTNTNAPPADQTTVWAYPRANDPNNAALDKTPEPSVPLGSFLRATPALGFVQFPASIINGDKSLYTPTDVIHTGGNGLRGQSVPMLYVATRGVNDTALYAVDVDGGTDDQRLIYREASPDSSIFQSSPVLVANTSNVGGNGGAVYAVTNNTLYDFSATPISNPGIIDPATGQAQNFPLIRENKAYTGFGPISSPAVAAADTTDLLTAAELSTFTGATGFTKTMTDWIYVGDSSTGFCRGITPFDTTDAGIPGGLGGIVPPTANPPGAVDLTASLQVYLVDSDHANSTRADVNADALKVGGPLPVYDWGQNVYIRFANVVPPGVDPTGKMYVRDPKAPPTGGPITYYGNGGPIEFDLSDSTDGTPPDHGTVPAVFVTAPAQATQPIPNGFIARTDKASGNYMDTNLVTATGDRYIGAYTYAISDGTARRNTPGSRRSVLNAKQVVHTFTFDGTMYTDTGTVTLVASVSNGNAISNPIIDPVTKQVTGYGQTLTAVPPVDQPTFGILNPLAVRAGGIPLQLNPGVTPASAVTIGDDVGPFRGVQSPISNTTFDLEALANGNNILQVTPQGPPKSTSGGGADPTKRNTLATNPPTTPHVVVTSTGLISHNTSGDNSDAAPSGSTLPLFPPTGTGSGGEGITTVNFGSQTAPYAMDVADRSALGLRRYNGLATRRLRVKTGTISGGGAGLYWNDNSVPTTGHDHDSVVNFLPWESAPLGYKAGANPSIDYPDIGPSDISATLYRYSGGNTDLTLGNAIAEPAELDQANGTDPVTNRLVKANPIRFQISVPHFQPANQQLYRQNVSGGTVSYSADPSSETTPFGILTPNDKVFPMGYVTTRRIYIPDQNGFYRPGAAFRDVRVYTGVPPDYSTEMADKTVTIPQNVPSGFGIQTSHYAPLNGTSPLDPTSPLGTFDMFNPAFVSIQIDDKEDYFRHLTIHNNGNVNLLNVHLDQKQQTNNSKPYALSLVSDTLDATSSIPGYDVNALTGPRSGSFGSVSELPFLVRSSLDTDLATAYSHNPLIQNPNNTNAAGVPLIQVYPGATFHKAQVGSGQPSTLSVPDSPEGFTPGASLDVSANLKPAIPNYTNGPVYKALPYVGVAIPFGTPVGSYHGLIQVFEGVDPVGYSTMAANADPPSVKQGPFASSGTFAGLTAQIYPPQYSGAVGGIGTPNTTNAPLSDIFQVAQAGVNAAGVPNPAVGLMPSSKNATVLNVKVGEARMTDGATYGATAMIDQGLAVPATTGANGTPARAVPDFAPAAFRDANSGYLSVYWTSGRNKPVNPGDPTYGIYSATVPMLAGAFMPVDPTTPGSATAPNYVNEWWTSLGNASTGYNAGALKPAIPTNQGTNSGLSIAQDAQNLGTIYAFGVNVQAPPLTTSYQNTLLGYTVDPKTGALGLTPQVVTNDPTQVKYGVKGLATDAALTKFTRNLWAFWTATTRGRTAVYYNSQDPTSKAWVPASGSSTPSTIGLLPIPAGLTAVADPAPLLMFGNVLVNGTLQSQATIEVTYSGTAPDGSVDLYQSRYQPDAIKASLLDLVPFPAVTEILTATGQPGGWSQARDVAWSRTSQLNLLVKYINNGPQVAPLLYDSAGRPLFSRAVFDKATGLLVLTGVPVPDELPDRAGSRSHTVYVDYATGRVRFSPALRATTAALMSQTYEVRALFSPLARRITSDSRADTGPVTFLDGAQKPDNSGLFPKGITTDRRWYVWRKSGAGGASPSATIYYKTQRLTVFLPYSVDPIKTISISFNGTPYSGSYDLLNIPAVYEADGKTIRYPASARIYFPIFSGAEGATVTGSYTPFGGTSRPINDTVQWQDETRSNDTSVPPTDATAGLADINQGYVVPLDNPINENNVSAFLDPLASLNSEHKVWLFWNSTRNGTADLYYETINPLFTAGP